MEKLADRLGQGGVHGPLYTLFECDEMFRTAVEVTAGNRWVDARTEWLASFGQVLFDADHHALPAVCSTWSSRTMTLLRGFST